MSIHDWLPKNHEALYNQSTQTMDYLTASANLTRMGFGADTPQGEWLVNTFDVAYTAWANPAERTTAKTAALTSAEEAFNPLYRQLYTGFLKVSPLVTDSDLVSMGLPLRLEFDIEERGRTLFQKLFVPFSISAREAS
ncbi:MAG: hypothetical protein LBC48_07665 [Dysgonamonadaceae bacterium]|jgi:hypothetical protein|nr:hypothetical protein [Dysgonamonadaceae bacterium]